MPKILDARPSKYTTPYGKKVISMNVSPELEKKIITKARSLDLTRQSYIITLINADLSKDKEIENGNVD